MKYLYSFLFIILFFGFSCNRVVPVEAISENTDTLKVDSDRIVTNIGEILMPRAKEDLENWKEYNDVDEFILRFYNTSTFEALTNAKELSELVKAMKDTIRIEKLKPLNMVARFNVLYNETLRLEDMATINSIEEEEVKDEVKKILEVYAAVNSKINTIYKAEDFQNSLEFDTETPVEIIKEEVVENKPKSSRLIKPKRARKQ